MKPYFDNGRETIYLGDCESIIGALKVDITVTSPPYNQIDASKMKPSGMFKSHGWIKTISNSGYSDKKDEPEYQKWCANIVSLCLKASKGLVWVNHKTRYRGKKAIHPLHFLTFPFYSEIVWDRGSSMTLNAKKFAPSHEFIYGFGLPHYWDNKYNTKLSVWRMNSTGHRAHPCAFPITLPLLLIGSSCPKDGIVLDPFMGSGTTLRAARMINRRAIGIEEREDYCEYAANRLSQDTKSFVS